MAADKASQAGVHQLVCSKWVGARCWCAGLLLASVVSGRASLLLVGVVSVRRKEEEEEEEEEFFNHCKERPKEARAYPVG